MRFKRMGLGPKLVAAFLAVGILPFAFMGLVSLINATGSLSDAAFRQMANVREAKRAELQRYFQGRREDLEGLVSVVKTLQQKGSEKLRLVQSIKKAQVEELFRRIFSDIRVLAANNTVIDGLRRFSAVFQSEGKIGSSPIYDYLVMSFGEALKEIKERYCYEDLLLISKEGRVVYTVNQGSDLGEDLQKGDLKDSPLSRIFQSALKGVSVQDFEPYTPDQGKYRAFVGAPVFKGKQLLGVVALKLSPEPFNLIMHCREGMGRTGETYLVGKSGGGIALRTDMIATGEKGFVYKTGHTISKPYTEAALSGRSGTGVFTDCLGNLVLVSFDPLQIEGLNWAIISKMNLEEVIVPTLEGEEKDFLSHYAEQYGYEDILLIHPQGQVFYSVARGKDLGANLLEGEYASTGLGRLVQKVLERKESGFADFELYPAVQDMPVAFLAAPMLHNGKLVLVVAVRISFKEINAIMQQRKGMGETGEAYLVGRDGLMRSDSILDPQQHSVQASFLHPERGRVRTLAAKEALSLIHI